VPAYFNREDESHIEVASPSRKVSFLLNYKLDKLSIMLRTVRFSEVVYLDPTMTDDTKFVANAFNNNTKETLVQTFGAKFKGRLSINETTKPFNRCK
jgi:iron complex outermembrane recepter protein